MTTYYAILAVVALAVFALDGRAGLVRAGRYLRPYRGRYERPARRSYEPRHRDRSRLGVPQCPPHLLRSGL